MLRKIIVIVAMVLLLGFSFSLVRKTADNEVLVNEDNEVLVEQPTLPEQTFSFNVAELHEDCMLDDNMFCAVETAVKCTLNPDFPLCAKAELPKFIFMRDASLDRPTEMSYKIVDKKTLSNDNVEVYTESNCNGGWLGMCQGTIIYVMAPKPEDSWYVKEIYAIE